MPQNRKYAALDIGGTKIARALVDDSGILSLYDERETPKSESYLISGINDSVQEMLDRDVAGIGISIAGPVTDDGTVVETPNMALSKDYPLQKELERKFGLPASVENDARCFALGVYKKELERAYQNIVCLTLGTGLGGAVIKDGKLEPRPEHAGDEIAHTNLVPGGRDCGCGRHGCFERYVTGSAIEEMYKYLTGEERTAREIARMGDKDAMQVIENAREYFGQVLDRLVDKYKPEIIVVGGGASNIPRMLEQNCMVPLKKSELENAMLIGGVIPLLG